MALLESEVLRIRALLGQNVMGISALPYIGITPIFDQVIQQYITSGAKTTSSSPVSAALVATPQSIILADGTGFAAGDRIVIDVDERQEVATIQHMPSATTANVLISKTHSGTYPVTVEGGESIVREALRQIRLIEGPGGSLERARSRAGIAKVDEIEFFGGAAGAASAGKDPLSQLMKLREFWVDRLADILGVERLNGGGGSCCSVY